MVEQTIETRALTLQETSEVTKWLGKRMIPFSWISTWSNPGTPSYIMQVKFCDCQEIAFLFKLTWS